jgi:hypothetical protein
MIFHTPNGSRGDTAKINRRYWAELAFKPPTEFVAWAAALRKINRGYSLRLNCPVGCGLCGRTAQTLGEEASLASKTIRPRNSLVDTGVMSE